MKQFDIRKLRYDLGIAQHELAKVLNLPQSSISAMERGRTRVASKHIAALQKAYDIVVDNYMVEAPETRPSAQAEVNAVTEADLLKLVERIQTNIFSQSEQIRLTEFDKYNGSIKQFQDLSSKIYTLQDKVNSLQEEIYRLKIKLIKHGIED